MIFTITVGDDYTQHTLWINQTFSEHQKRFDVWYRKTIFTKKQIPHKLNFFWEKEHAIDYLRKAMKEALKHELFLLTCFNCSYVGKRFLQNRTDQYLAQKHPDMPMTCPHCDSTEVGEIVKGAEAIVNAPRKGYQKDEVSLKDLLLEAFQHVMVQ